MQIFRIVLLVEQREAGDSRLRETDVRQVPSLLCCRYVSILVIIPGSSIALEIRPSENIEIVYCG